MLNIKKLIISTIFAATMVAFVPSEAQADGPLRRWFRGILGQNRAQSCNTCSTPQTAGQYGYYQPTQAPVTQTANYAPNVNNLQPGQCMKTCQQTCTRTVVNYVPQTAYRTNWNRVPVTTYRPVTNSDPVTGCTVTCMRPCTNYTYQCQRVPYTTYRPVYRQESYKVPVTTITNDCATGNCNTGCNTCNTGTVGVTPQPNFGPTPATTTANYAPATYYGTPAYVGSQTYSGPATFAAPGTTGYTVPQPTTTTHYEVPTGGTLGSQGVYGNTPADSIPSVNNGASLLNGVANPQNTQRPFIDRFNERTNPGFKQASATQTRTPARFNLDRTAQSPVRKQFNYSPIRMASHQKNNNVRTVSQTAYSGQLQRSRNAAPRNDSKLNGWAEVN